MSNRKTIQQVAVIAYDDSEAPCKVVLVTSMSRHRWVLPKGHIDRGHTPRQAAIQEAYEEAGVEGRVGKQEAGHYVYTKPDDPENSRYAVTVFTMKVTAILETWPEIHARRRTWMTFDEAAAAVDEDELKAILLNVTKRLEK